jgi:hypothetical protein
VSQHPLGLVYGGLGRMLKDELVVVERKQLGVGFAAQPEFTLVVGAHQHLPDGEILCQNVAGASGVGSAGIEPATNRL